MSGTVTQFIQREFEPGDHFGREVGVLEDLLDVRIALADLFEARVLEALGVIQGVVVNEVEQAVGGHIPGATNAKVLDEGVALGVPLEDLMGQVHPGGLPADLPVAFGGAEDAPQEAPEVVDAQVLLGHLDEGEPLRQQATDERDARVAVVGGGDGHLSLLGGTAETLHQVAGLDEAQVPLVGGDGHEAELVLADPLFEQVRDFPIRQGDVGHVDDVLEEAVEDVRIALGEGLIGPAMLFVHLGVVGGVELHDEVVDAGYALVREGVHQAPQNSLPEHVVGFVQEVQDDPPLGRSGRRAPLAAVFFLLGRADALTFAPKNGRAAALRA